MQKTTRKNIGKSQETSLGNYCHSWVMFMVILWKRYGQKLRRILLLHFGSVIFQCHYGRDRKPFMFMISGFLDVSMSPKTNYVYLWRHQETSNNSRVPDTLFEKKKFANLKKWTSHILETLGKRWGRRIPTTRLSNSLKILNVGSISWNLSKS